MMRARQIARLVLVFGVLFLPRAAGAQSATSGSIAGVVKDTTGAVLPGVTVEAASPALIEKVRTVVTDGQGQYKIVELRPGTYSVTFTLTGFNTFKREALELTTGITAAVNAEMRVGALEETVTVTGQSPVVDTQNVRSQTVLSRTVLDALPTGKAVQAYAALTVGAVTAGAGGAMHDVGGNKGEQYGTMMIHGGRSGDGRLNHDGMRYSNNVTATGAGFNRFWIPNQAAVQEVLIETSGMSAEAENGGVHQNAVPKDGGNIFKIYFNITGTNENLQSSNLTDRLRTRGLTSESKVHKIWDIGGGLGGPIKRDTLWFYTAHRWWGSQENYAGLFHNKTQGTPFYTEDTSRPFWNDLYNEDHGLRLTWQALPKHRITGYGSVQNNCQCSFNSGSDFRAPEASTDFVFQPLYLLQSTWSYPATDRILFQAGATYSKNVLNPRRRPGVTENDIVIRELSKAFTYNAASGGLGVAGYTGPQGDGLGQHNERFSMSYITGSHAVKVGLFTMLGTQNFYRKEVNQALYYDFNFGVPVQLVQWASPASTLTNGTDVAAYVQDQWTVKNLTLNLGVRFDYFNAYVPEQDRPAGRFVSALHVNRIDNVPNFTDLSPRLGVAYDLFGNGKTAVKASVGKYMAALGPGYAGSVNPANALVLSSTRTWGDANKDFKPDCDLTNFAANGECGRLDNQRFGTVRTLNTYAKDALEGFGKREYNWQTSVSVQHELRPGMAVNVGYFRTWFGNFLATDNLLTTPADYDPYCVTAPVDARLPGGGGYQACGLGDIKPTKFGLVDNLVTQASNFGDRREVYDGVDATVNVRFGEGGLLQGGINTGRTQTQCVVVDAPVQFCKNVPPFLTQIKFAGVYPLPWGLQMSATFQNLPGAAVGTTNTSTTSRVFTNAEIKPSLGRDLAQGAKGVASVLLVAPNTLYEDRLTQLDLRFTKSVRLGRGRVQGNFDIYNIFNGDTILSVNPRYGAVWLRPLQIMGGRLFKFGAQLDF